MISEPIDNKDNKVLTLRYLFIFALLFGIAGWLGLPAASLSQSVDNQNKIEKQVEVIASAGWVDTGIDVKEGEVLEFLATGTISCQKGNPIANCGPEGLDLQTVQQPLPDKNLGALVGKVVKVVSVTKDPDTGEEIREEVVKVFYIGEKATVEMPLEGRLFLGVNDNVYADDDGKFLVLVSQKEKGPEG
ncbi:MAG: hypothetical protein ACPLRX_05660 [Candidatus Saccharicenans sp.]